MFKSVYTIDSDEVNVFKAPIIVGIILVYLAAVFLQNTYKLSLSSTIWFTIAMLFFLCTYLFANNIFKHRHWLYFLVQGIIVFDCAVIMPKGYETIFFGLIPLLILQSMIVYHEAIKVIITSIFFYGIFCGTIIIFDGVEELIRSIPMLLVIIFALRIYSSIFLKQVKMRIRTQKLLQELELAYEQVEELTLTNERQRMARDLHDTLSQGLAGVIMQLEAIHANLKKDHTKRAQEIVEKSMEHARKTLGDSRLIIDDLRLQAKADTDFMKAVENEIAQFKAVCNTSITEDLRIESQISPTVSKHILYIVREALNNIAKHARARNVIVEIIEKNNQIYINILDDGMGFDVKLLDQLFGHYGILGMTERVKAIHGEIRIKSKRKFGTKLNIIIPIEKGIYGENEEEKNIGGRRSFGS